MSQPSENNIDQIAGKLMAYLRTELNDSTIAYDLPLTQLLGGSETSMYQFKLKGVQKELNPHLVLRLCPQHQVSEGVLWESSVQNVLADVGYPVARVYFICADESILGRAFFVMDFLPGKEMCTAPEKTWPEILANTHITLHRIDPGPLIKSLNEQGYDENQYGFDKWFVWLTNTANELPGCRGVADWLIENRPPEPERLTICHGDFHHSNILIQNGKVTGVLDWNLRIADPALDVAQAIKLITVHHKHFSEPVSVFINWEKYARRYLDAYQTHIPLDSTKLDYYGVFWSLQSLIDGLRGQSALRRPSFVKDLIKYIHKVTEVRITMPG